MINGSILSRIQIWDHMQSASNKVQWGGNLKIKAVK